jgi:hypothetical protein
LRLAVVRGEKLIAVVRGEKLIAKAGIRDCIGRGTSPVGIRY